MMLMLVQRRISTGVGPTVALPRLSRTWRAQLTPVSLGCCSSEAWDLCAVDAALKAVLSR